MQYITAIYIPARVYAHIVYQRTRMDIRARREIRHPLSPPPRAARSLTPKLRCVRPRTRARVYSTSAMSPLFALSKSQPTEQRARAILFTVQFHFHRASGRQPVRIGDGGARPRSLYSVSLRHV